MGVKDMFLTILCREAAHKTSFLRATCSVNAPHRDEMRQQLTLCSLQHFKTADVHVESGARPAGAGQLASGANLVNGSHPIGVWWTWGCKPPATLLDLVGAEGAERNLWPELMCIGGC